MKKNTIFRGTGVAIVTPMKADGSVNYEKYRELVEWQIENGTDAIIACGTTGESSTLNHEEHTSVIRATVEQVKGRIPVIAGTGSNETSYCIELSEEAKRLKADALLVVTPYYNKTSQRGLIAHYNTIADRVRMPLILYNVPSRTGVDIQPETYRELSKNPLHRRVKEANGNMSSIVTHGGPLRRQHGFVFRKRRSGGSYAGDGRQGRHLRHVQHPAQRNGPDLRTLVCR